MSEYNFSLKSSIYGDIMYKWGKVFSKTYSLTNEEFDDIEYQVGDIVKVGVTDGNDVVIEIVFFKVIERNFYPKAVKRNNCYVKFEYTTLKQT